MLLLDVIIIYPNNLKIKCGEIITGTSEGNGRIKGAFRYTPEYLQHPDAFPIDPANLPLAPKEFSSNRPQGIHGVFEDALPDDWGRKILVRKATLPPREQTEPKLLEALGNSGMGALCFETGNAIKTPLDPSADILNLEQLLELAVRYDAGEQLSDQDFCSLAVCGSSPGGARPKSLIRDKDNFLWLAKFPKHNDHFHVEQIEAATLKLAENSGLKVPEFKILTVGSRKALLVKRFDVTDDSGRYHMISMKTVLNAQYYAWYEDIFKAVKKYSTQPSVDIPALFRQMVFNAAIGNTDDHLKNFCMLHKETGYCLSPAFDLLPDIHGKRSHSLSFPKGSGEFSPNRSVLLAYAADLNIKNPDSIIDAVIQAVSAWQDVYAAYDVPDTDIQKLDRDISYRLDKLKN
ncbi:MAG: type II toxin-antitoxin system HipA family toxin [Thermodesulfobacteriota bacterium]|nr:type II toxin-antitoxin system HipA family toxin [Thermodesulfobacteriota bacterium]